MLFDMLLVILLLTLPAGVLGSRGHRAFKANSTIHNPIFPGFYPDPSCIYVPEWDKTFFCISSSFNAFPGIPLHASKDLQNWKLIGHVLNRKEQLPQLAETNRSTSGIWAPTLRYHRGTIWVLTTLVDDDRPQDDASRWDNIIFKAKDPYDPASWSNAVRFKFEGYDPEPFWDVDGKVYIAGAHAWRVGPYIQLAEANLDTGEVGEWRTIWNGTGGMAPEGPHIYRKDGWYYLLAAEGGTGLGHMVTMARSLSVFGPYEPHPNNPVLTNANTTNYFQTVGHADLFQDWNGNWWAVALSTRSGPGYLHYPMGRETVMTAVSWPKGEWPTFTQVSGRVSGWPLPPPNTKIRGVGPFVNHDTPEHLTFAPNSKLPAHLTCWRFPPSYPTKITISPPGRHAHTLRLDPSRLNLTALNGNYAGSEGQTFISRRQQHTRFTYRVDLTFNPSPTAKEEGVEAGITTFLTQNHHLRMGVALLRRRNATCGSLPGLCPDNLKEKSSDPDELILHVHFRGESYVPVPEPVVAPLPRAWRGKKLTLEVKAQNETHFTFGIGVAGAGRKKRNQWSEVMVVSNEPVSWGFTGTLLGIYCTSNGGNGTTPAYFSDWKYIPQGQRRD